jgi:hypothetical protein
MDRLKQWWFNDLSKGVKIVLLVLLANAVPAFIILMSLPGMTETLFVWTIKSKINARLMGVMYGNALLLVCFSLFQTTWARVRINVVAITVFSLLATALTFVYLKPFLAHPWFHLTYWLGMYFVLFFVAPTILVSHERKYGGRLPVQVPLNAVARLLTGILLLVSTVCGLGLLFRIKLVNQFWPWNLPPLVGGLIGVLFFTHAAAYAWALWDGDWLRVRPIFWQAPPTGLLLMLLPLIHPAGLRPDAGLSLVLYYSLNVLAIFVTLGTMLGYRDAEKALTSYGQ